MSFGLGPAFRSSRAAWACLTLASAVATSSGVPPRSFARLAWEEAILALDEDIPDWAERIACWAEATEASSAAIVASVGVRAIKAFLADSRLDWAEATEAAAEA